MEIHGGAEPHLQHLEDKPSSRWISPEGSFIPQQPHARAGSRQELQPGAHTEAGFPAEPATHGGPLLEQSVSDSLYPMMRTQAGAGEEHQEIGKGTTN